MANNFKDSLRVPSEFLDEIDHRIEEILAISEKYYTEEYKQLYKEHFLAEFLELKSQFPNVDFDYSGRFKNKESMTEKISRKIKEHKSGNVYDIFANKIVIHSINGETDEELLKKACQDMSDFLTTYYSSFFDESLKELEDKRKNYISTPKSNGYQAIHVIRQHSIGKHPPFLSETQIRTFRMEEQQKFGSSSHAKNYKNYAKINLSRCPSFLEITKSKKTGIYKVHEFTEEQSFKKYKEYLQAVGKRNDPELTI